MRLNSHMNRRAAAVIFLSFACVSLLFTAGFSSLQREEKLDYYKKWLEQDVGYIITPEERTVFEKLQTEAEKEAFIEQFWRRRDPTPETAINEFSEEHYRRIQYANDNFSSGVPGWKTDRGRIYIVYGPPEERETYPTGGGYARPLSEGGGGTATYPFERWFYRHLPGVGEGVEIEFVDRTHTGEYRLARHPGEKDALLFTPGGKTLYESWGLDTRYDRIARTLSLRDHSQNVLTRDLLAGREKTFDRLQQFFVLGRTPNLKFKDLEASVDSRISYHQFPVSFRYDYFRVDENQMIVPITLAVANRELTYRPTEPGRLQTKLQLYGRLESLQRRIAGEFEDDLTSEIPEGSSQQGELIYQRRLLLNPGRYKLVVVMKDVQSERLSTLESPVIIPGTAPGDLLLGSLVLTKNVLPLEEGETLADPYVVPAGVKIYPSLDHEFEAQRSMGFYYEIYGFAADASGGLPAIRVRHRLKSGDRLVYEEEMDLLQARSTLSADRATVIRILSLQPFGAADFLLEVEVKDEISRKSTSRQVRFKTR